MNEKKSNGTQEMPKKTDPEFKPFSTVESTPPGRLTVQQAKAKKQELRDTFIATNRLEVEFEYWAKMSSWNAAEFAMLLNGIEPRKALAKGATYIADARRHRVPEFIKFESDLLMIERAIKDGELDLGQQPLLSIGWCLEKELVIPEELLQAVKKQRERQKQTEAIGAEVRKQIAEEDKPESDKPYKNFTPTKKGAGPDELANRLRLIGTLSNMLQDDTIDPKYKKNADTIATYIANTYGIDMPHKGLAKDTVVKALGAAKKRLKEDGVK